MSDSNEPLDPEFWGKFRTERAAVPKKRPELLQKLQQRRQQSVVAGGGTTSDSSSTSEAAVEMDVEHHHHHHHHHHKSHSGIAPQQQQHTIESVKRPRLNLDSAPAQIRLAFQQQQQSERYKQQIEALLELRQATRNHKARLEESEQDYEDRLEALKIDINHHYHCERARNPPPSHRLCKQTPVLQRFLDAPLTDRQPLPLLYIQQTLAHYNAQKIFLDLAQGRLALDTGRVTAGADHSTYDCIVARDASDNRVVFYNVQCCQ